MRGSPTENCWTIGNASSNLSYILHIVLKLILPSAMYESSSYSIISLVIGIIRLHLVYLSPIEDYEVVSYCGFMLHLSGQQPIALHLFAIEFCFSEEFCVYILCYLFLFGSLTLFLLIYRISPTLTPAPIFQYLILLFVTSQFLYVILKTIRVKFYFPHKKKLHFLQY